MFRGLNARAGRGTWWPGGALGVVAALALTGGALWGCTEGPDEAAVAEEPDRPPAGGDATDRDDATGRDATGRDDEATRLHVPPPLIHRARREAAGLSRMPEGLRAQTLADRRAEPRIDYATLRAEPGAHAEASVSFEGHVGLVRPAGPRLWILALLTRRDGARWTDPLYVLSVAPPQLPADGGGTARVDGWVVGERTIGRHALPLVVAYQVERTSPPAGAEDQ